MQNWPYADVMYLNAEHMRSLPQQKDALQKWEYLTVEVVFPSASENAVMFFDHYANDYKSRRSELNEYLEKLDADSWTLTMAGPIFKGKAYSFRRIQFRRLVH